MKLRTRLALLLALLAGLSATAVGLAGYSATSSAYRGEIEKSLDDFAARLAQPDSPDAQRSCTSRDRGPGEARPEAFGGRQGAPAGIVVQCLDRTGAVTLAPRFVDLPVDDADKTLAAANGAGSARTRTVEVSDRSYLQITVPVSGGAIQIAREVSENTMVLEHLLRRFALLVLAATGLAGLAGVLVARRTARPLTELTSTAEEIAARGRLDVALPVPRHDDETGRLTRAFATMVDALRTSKQQQTQLVHDAGHELRTPLTSLRTNIGVLRRHPDMAAEKRQGVIDDLHAELAELTELVDELITLAADANPADSNDPVETVALGSLVRDVAERWERRTTRPITVAMDDARGVAGGPSDEAAFDVQGRSRLLARAVSNLVSNATKFSPSGAPVDLHLVRRDSTIELRVRDHGPGIPDDDLPKIFDRFYRSTVHRNHPGSGLGLSIVAQVVAEHRGTVRAQNVPDGGAEFVITLPVG